jgi:general secretion pathway protein K
MNSSRSRRCSTSLRRRSRNKGIALVTVLWLLLLLSGLAATVAYVARENALLVHRSLDFARAQAAADSGIVHAISSLSDEQPARHPAIGGATQSWEFDSVPVSIDISAEASRIDVNAAGDVLLLAFVEAQGVSPDSAATLLVDLRERQNAARVRADHGIGIADHHISDALASPPGEPLASVGELREIPSWRAQNLDCWEHSFTVYTGQPDINLAGSTAQTRAAVNWLRTHSKEGGVPSATISPAPTAGNNRSVLGEVFRIRATATVSDNATATTQWVGRLTGDSHHPMLTMLWSHDVPASDPNCSSDDSLGH